MIFLFNFFKLKKMSLSLKDYVVDQHRDPVSWEFYKRQMASFWYPEEFEFVKDREDYLSASPRIQNLLKEILGFFLVGDGLISEDILVFQKAAILEKNWPKYYYLTAQNLIENVHAETYTKAAKTIVPEEEQAEIVKMCEDVECVRAKGEWIQRYIDSQESEALQYVACACGEGIFFVGLFSIIFYMRKLNKFKNFIESNEQISKDESLHRDQKAAEAKVLLKPEEFDKAKEIITRAVELEKSHANHLLREPIVSEESDKDSGMTQENLGKYIEMLADQVSVLCGMEIIFGSKAELKWMEDINLSQKTNFYERDVVGSYRGINPETAISGASQVGNFDNFEEEDF